MISQKPSFFWKLLESFLDVLWPYKHGFREVLQTQTLKALRIISRRSTINTISENYFKKNFWELLMSFLDVLGPYEHNFWEVLEKKKKWFFGIFWKIRNQDFENFEIDIFGKFEIDIFEIIFEIDIFEIFGIDIFKILKSIFSKFEIDVFKNSKSKCWKIRNQHFWFNI